MNFKFSKKVSGAAVVFLTIAMLMVAGCGGGGSSSSGGNSGGNNGGGNSNTGGTGNVDGTGVRPTVTTELAGTVNGNTEVTVNKIGAWFESAYIEWSPVTDATGYNVYYKGGTITDWTKIDNELIREYNNNVWRADVLGLAGNNTYNFAVLPVYAAGESSTSKDSASGGLATPIAHIREGYAFSSTISPGAYNSNGTLKDNAVVVYITPNNKNTVSLEVNGASSNPCVGLKAILDGFKKGKDTRPLCVRLIGNITDFASMDDGDIVIENDNTTAGITFEGVGDDAVANGWGIRIKNASYIEIRNLGLMNCDSGEGDDIGLQQSNRYIWVHNCDFFYGKAGSDSDQAKGDGALDTKKSMYVTHSYNHFWDCGKCNLVGNKENIDAQNYLTFHHNWYDHSDSRHPRIRVATVHVYNNYYDGNAKYGVGATMGSSVFVENNYFRNCKYPILTSMQGSDVYSTGTARDTTNNPTFSKEEGGSIKAYNNIMTGTYTFIPYGADTIVTAGVSKTASERGITTTSDFDAYVVSERNTNVPSSVVSFSGGNTYNNFDSSLYSYTPNAVADVPTEVTKYAGRVDGGDFQWSFTDADDIDYDVNTSLQSALLSYSSALKSIGGVASTDDGSDDNSGGGGNDSGDGGNGGSGSEIVGDISHNFTADGKTSAYFTITGNLGSGKGTVTYAGLTLTTPLKMESDTNISFTTTKAMTLTLVFGGTTSAVDKKVKVDEIEYTTVASGDNYIVTVSLAAGAHTITKKDGINLYYMALDDGIE